MPGPTVKRAPSGFKKFVPFQISVKSVLLSQPENNGIGIPVIEKHEKINN